MVSSASGTHSSVTAQRVEPDEGSLLSFDPRKLIVIFLRRLLIFALVAAVVFVAVVVLAILQPRQYGGTASVLIEPSDANFLKPNAPQRGSASDVGAVDTEVQLISSPTLATLVADKLNLYADPEFNSDIKPGVPGALRGPIAPAAVDQTTKDLVAGRLLTHVQAKRAGLTYVIDITARSHDPNKAARIANAFADGFLQLQLDAKYNVTHSNSAYLNDRLNSLQKEVEVSDGKVQDYKIAHGLLSADGATMAEQEVSSLNQQIAAAQADSAEKEARLRAAEAQVAQGGGGGDVGAALGSGTIGQLRAQEAEASRHVAELTTRYGPRYPEVQKAQNQLEDIHNQIQAEINRILSSLRADVQVANQRANSLRGSEGSARGSLASNNQAQTGLLELQRKADADRAIYEAFLAQSKETASTEGLQQPDARITSTAQPSLKAVSPKMSLAAALGVILGLGAGLAAIIVAEMFDTSLRTSADVENNLGVAYAGGIPIPQSTGKERASDKKVAPQDYVLKHPFSTFAEAFRNIRTFMLLAGEDGGPAPKIIAITSALPKEGKSVTSFSLMRVMAQAGSSVVLVDCDLRRRGVTQFVGDPAAGLVEVLEGTATLDQVLVLDEASGGWILPVHSMPTNPKDYLSLPQMDALLKTLSDRFDLVILDTPPALALADARTISAKADKTLFLMHWGKTPRRASEAAIGLLLESGAHIAGVSLTRVDMNKQSQQGYGDYGYYYKSYRSYYQS